MNVSHCSFFSLYKLEHVSVRGGKKKCLHCCIHSYVSPSPKAKETNEQFIFALLMRSHMWEKCFDV